MKVKIENALKALKVPLRERLDRVINHLREATWPDRNALCHAGRSNSDAPPWSWDGPHRSEADLMRFEAYTWSKRQLQGQFDQPVTIFEALNLIEDNATQLVASTVDIIGISVDGLVEKEFRSAVLSRKRLAEEWPWPLETRHGGAFVHLLLALCPVSMATEQLFTRWPPYTASFTVADWAKTWLLKNAHPTSRKNVVDLMKQTTRNTPMVFTTRPGLPFTKMATPALALLYNLEYEVKENQKRPFIAIDTCKEHTKFVESWRDLPKSRKPAQWALKQAERLELILPDEQEKRHLQLSLDLGSETLAVQVAHLLREWRSWIGLRHWVAFQSQITNNKRLGWVRWTVNEHLEAMGHSKHRARRSKLRRQAADMVELFTRIELGIYDERGKLRERRPLVLKGNTYERLEGSQWEIEGLELKVNPLLYRGVRDPETGRLGKSWWPTPKELAHIDHEKYGPAIAFGTVLPGRWRMELSQSELTYVDLTGDSLLRAGGMPYRPRNLVTTWRSLERNLAELQRRGGIERWEWQGEPDLATVCRLYAPRWAVDRVVHGVPPKELNASPVALTGSELKAWRKKEGLTQKAIAKALDVSESTIRRAENRASQPLSKKLRTALNSLSAHQIED